MPDCTLIPENMNGIILEDVLLVKSGADKVAPWFKSSRAAQIRLVGKYSEAELELLADFFEKATVLWEGERMKLAEE